MVAERRAWARPTDGRDHQQNPAGLLVVASARSPESTGPPIADAYAARRRRGRAGGEDGAVGESDRECAVGLEGESPTSFVRAVVVFAT